MGETSTVFPPRSHYVEIGQQPHPPIRQENLREIGTKLAKENVPAFKLTPSPSNSVAVGNEATRPSFNVPPTPMESRVVPSLRKQLYSTA